MAQGMTIECMRNFDERFDLQAEAAIVQLLLDAATVYRPQPGRKWVAAFTGPQEGQRWLSTGLENREAALIVARK